MTNGQLWLYFISAGLYLHEGRDCQVLRDAQSSLLKTDRWQMRMGSDSSPENSACDSICLNQWSPTFLAPRTGFTEDNFSMDWVGRMVSRWFKHVTFIVLLWECNAAAGLTGGRAQVVMWAFGAAVNTDEA